MKKYPIYLLLLTFCMLTACGNSDKDSKNKQDSTASQLDTTITKTESAVKLDTADVSFFEHAAYGGMTEVESSNKILQFTKDTTVKTFAQMMVKDHGKANEQLKSIAKGKGYVLPTLLPATKMKLITALDDFKDEGRDEYYMQLMVAEHQNAINLFTLASHSKDAEISKFASTLLPTLNHHYQHTLRIDSIFKAAKANQGDDPLKISDRKKK
jgi:putative membrane protein